MNIAEILKKCPKGTKLYSLIHGEVTLGNIISIEKYPIEVVTDDGCLKYYTKDGLVFANRPNGECVLFPSKEQRDWSKFEVPGQETKPQFKPFDKVLVRDCDTETWGCNLFGYIDKDGDYMCVNGPWSQCVPYEGNEHLLGTTNKPE